MADSEKLSLSLDDVIRIDRSSRRGGRRGGGNRERGGRIVSNGFRARGGGGLPRTSNTPTTGRWKHDLFDGNASKTRDVPRSTGINSTTRLLISNLDYAVTSSDIQELFEDIGAIRVARVHYDETGRSLGTAEVVYERRVDAIAAQKKYHSLNLDGRPMDIKIVGINEDAPKQQPTRFSSGNEGNNRGRQFGGMRNNQQSNGQGNRTRGGKQQQNGTSRKKNDITAEELDAELDAYRAQSKQEK